MSYFAHRFISNSDLKALAKRLDPNAMADPENLEEIFELGTLIHQILLEPHKANREHKDFKLAEEMSKTVLRDKLCRQFIFMPDFRREHEFYKHDLYGLPSRAKSDGDSRMISTGLEYKGLGVTTQKQFIESIYTFNYDQGVAWYLDTTKFKQFLIVGVSKKHPDRIFKELVDRNHKMYEIGSLKVEAATRTWKEFFGTKARGIVADESFIE